MCVCVCVCVRVRVCACVCVCVRMHACMYISVYMYVRARVFSHRSMHQCGYSLICKCTPATLTANTSMRMNGRGGTSNRKYIKPTNTSTTAMATTITHQKK